MANTTLASICSDLSDPCEVYQLLEKAYLERLLGETAIKVKIGQEETTLALPSVEKVEKARQVYASRCRAAGGCAPGGRVNLCFEYGEHACRRCGKVSCRC